jgi:hypothetical protein
MFDLDLGVPLRDDVLETDSDLTLLLIADVNGVAEVEATERMTSSSSSLGKVGRLKEPPSSWTNSKINHIPENNCIRTKPKSPCP